jgi:dTDP-4-dehydrorhamnose 3,5-epimerase
MMFRQTPVQGAYLIDLEPRGDSRGFFARLFCREEFQKRGLVADFPQVNNSLSAEKGTLRGMHYQLAPHGEDKLVRCVKGRLYDVVLDLRLESPTFGCSYGAELSADNRSMMYVPKGCAHGFQTLEDATEAIYLVSHPYHFSSERIVRWNDPTFKIQWPVEPTVLSDKDANAPDFNTNYHLVSYK